MRAYSAAPPSGSNLAESSFAPTSDARATDAPVRSAAATTVARARVRIPIHPVRTPHGPQRLGSLKSVEERVKQMLRPEPYGVVGGQAGLLGCRLDRPSGVVVVGDGRRVHGHAYDLGLPGGQ